jgi:hypothetical protein
LRASMYKKQHATLNKSLHLERFQPTIFLPSASRRILNCITSW